LKEVNTRAASSEAMPRGAFLYRRRERIVLKGGLVMRMQSVIVYRGKRGSGKKGKADKK